MSKEEMMRVCKDYMECLCDNLSFEEITEWLARKYYLIYLNTITDEHTYRINKRDWVEGKYHNWVEDNWRFTGLKERYEVFTRYGKVIFDNTFGDILNYSWEEFKESEFYNGK